MGESSDTAQLWVAVIAIAVTVVIAIVGGLVSVIVALLKRNADRSERHEEGREGELRQTRDRVTDKQATQGEVMAGVVARIGQLESGQNKLEDGYEKVADALDRLTRLEEFRLHADPKLKEAEETARTVIAFGEQMKTVFKRIDLMSEQMNKQSEKIDDMPDAVVTKLRHFVRTADAKQAGRAANG